MSSPASQLVDLAAGHQLDRYELICPVAQGGMASVWLARLKGKHGFEKLVALKTILPSLAEDKRFRRMLLAEAKIASRIEHVNVAQTLDLGEQDGHLYLVMEWVDGDSLSKLDRALEKASLSMPLPILLRVMIEACAGLHAAHELCDDVGTPLGVVHRDVSPQNILVSAKGQTKLIDFGIAKAQSGPSEETRAGILKGKIHYMPPEQAMRGAVDRRTDVWAVGAVLYRMLCRRTPYESDSPVSMLRLLTSRAPPAPLPAEVDRELAALVLQALSPNPEHRPATALELQGELERLGGSRLGLCTSQELASFVTGYLGSTLQERRDKITRALRSVHERDTAVSGFETGSDAISGLQDTAADTPQARAEPDTVVHPSFSSSALTLQMPSRAPEPASRKSWAAAAVVLAALGTAFWSLSSRTPASAHLEATAPKSAAASAAPASEPAAPALPSPVAVEQLLPAPVAPSALPLSPARTERPSAKPTSAKPVGVKAARPPAPKAKPLAPATPKRKVVDDGF